MALTFPGGYQWPELADRLTAAGIWLRFRNNVALHDEPAAQAVIDAYTLADAKAWVRDQIGAHADALQKARDAKQGLSAGEVFAATEMLAQARKYQASGVAGDAPALQASAAVSGETLAQCAARIANGAAAIVTWFASLDGNRRKHVLGANACSTFVQLAAYDWRTGWPAP